MQALSSVSARRGVCLRAQASGPDPNCPMASRHIWTLRDGASLGLVGQGGAAFPCIDPAMVNAASCRPAAGQGPPRHARQPHGVPCRRGEQWVKVRRAMPAMVSELHGLLAAAAAGGACEAPARRALFCLPALPLRSAACRVRRQQQPQVAAELTRNAAPVKC